MFSFMNDSFTAYKLLKVLVVRIPRGNSFLVFHGLPQGSLIVHSFCTRG